MMFERFTRAARDIVVAAESEAARLHAREIGTEHLLLALAGPAGDEAALLLARLNLDADALRAAVRGAEGPDPEALAVLGIDLDEVRRQAEETFGPGALDRPPRCGGNPRFGRDAKKALELTLREAIALGHRELRPVHMLLALTRDDRATGLLARQGIDPSELRAAVTDALGRGDAAA